MRTPRQKWILWSEIVLAWLVLLLLLFYTYLEIIKAPYIGFNFDSLNGRIRTVYIDGPLDDLEIGDQVVAANGKELAQPVESLRHQRFAGVEPGETLILQVKRQNQEAIEEVQWIVPGFNQDEFNDRVSNAWLLAYLFWLVGLTTLLAVRPLDTKRRLFTAFFMLTALWLVVGSTTRWGHGESRIVFRIALWLSVPVLLHLHWIFPRSLSKLPRLLLWGLYGVAALASLLQWFEQIPAGHPVLAFSAALLASLILLLAHYLLQPETHAQVRLLIFALLVAILPLASLSIVSILRQVSYWGPYTLAALPLIPGAYFYSIYRYQLGGIEFRANRLISVYLFLILLGTVMVVVSTALNVRHEFVGGSLLRSILFGWASALAALYLFPPFQRLVERWLLGMPLPPMQLIDTYLARITTTLNQERLVQLLRNEVLPSLLIRESALYRVRNNVSIPLYVQGAELAPETLADLLLELKRDPLYRVSSVQDSQKPITTWVRLALALQVEGKLIGFWLFGRHDPDDLYSQMEITTLQTLAHQTALALANIEQSDQLQALYQANIDSQETERTKLAHVLHDEILNEAAVLYMSLDAAALTPRAEATYETLKRHIRQMISDLRPPSLDLGLYVALEGLADELDQRAQPSCMVRFTIAPAAVHYPPQVENHLFRIVQQACENALRHARSQTIQISGVLMPDQVELVVEDNGVGFALSEPFDLNHLLAHKHFGLVHMVERAEHIKADLALDSAPGKGTRVRLTWSDRGEVGS
jgi:signal transduction histidine kinase